MKEIEMRPQSRRRNLPAHAIAGFEQWPIERLSIEGNNNRALSDPLSQGEQHRAFLAVFAQEELLNLKAAVFPPRNTNEECVRAAPAGKAGRFRVQKEPLLWIGDFVCSVRRQQSQGAEFGRIPRRLGTPAAHGNALMRSRVRASRTSHAR